jgi:hypothetical protein
VAIVGVLAICAAGCGSESPAGTGSEDGGTDGEPDPTEEGGADGGRMDAAPDGPIFTGYCATVSPKPRFCDSFDDGVLANGWDQQTVLNGQLTLETGMFRSGPASLAVDTGMLMMMENANVSLRTTVGGAGNRVRFAVSVYFSQVTFAQGVFGFATVDVSATHYFNLWLRDLNATPAAVLEELDGATVTRNVLTSLPAAQIWSRLEVDLDLAGGTGTLKWDGATAWSGAIAAKPALDPTIRIGAVYVNGPAPAFSALYDDLVLDF